MILKLITMKKFLLDYFYLPKDDRQFILEGLAFYGIMIALMIGTLYGLYYLNLWLN